MSYTRSRVLRGEDATKREIATAAKKNKVTTKHVICVTVATHQ